MEAQNTVSRRLRWQPSPILIKEMRSTMRGARTFVGMTLFLLLLAGISLLIYYGATLDGGGQSLETGRIIFSLLIVFESLMLVIVAPPLTAGSIASERQKQTFDMLMATPLTPRQVLVGKLLASMNYLFLLMFAALPINSLVFVFGGVDPGMLLWWVVLLVVTLLMLGTLGLWMSTLFRNSGIATALTYLLSASLFVIFPIVIIIFVPILTSYSELGQCVSVSIAMLNPAASLAAILVNDASFVTPIQLLPASLTLFGAVAGVFFLAAQARLSQLATQRMAWRTWLLMVLLLGVASAAAAYIIVKPVQDVCNF